MKHAWCAHWVSVCERRVFWFVSVKKNTFVTVDGSSVKVWGCRTTVQKKKKIFFQTQVWSSTQIFDNLWGREPLQVIKDSPKVKCLYRQQGNITDSCLQRLNVSLLLYGQGQKYVARISKPGNKQWKCVFSLATDFRTYFDILYKLCIESVTFFLPLTQYN